MTISSRQDQDKSTTIPGYAKVIMLLEALVISILILWIYQEYHSNVYLQAYLNNLPLEAEKSPALADHLTEQRLIEMIGRKDLSDD